MIRYEWQNRGGIHGLARLGHAPDTYRLADEIITGFVAQRDLCLRANNDQLQNQQTRQVAELNAIIERGERSKQTLKEFFNDFVCADFSISFGQWVSPRQRQPPNNSVPMTINDYWLSFCGRS